MRIIRPRTLPGGALRGLCLAACLLLPVSPAAQEAQQILGSLLLEQPMAPEDAVPRETFIAEGLGRPSEVPDTVRLADVQTIADYRRSVIALEATEGPYAEGLAEQYRDLAAAYERNGDYELALASYEDAQQVVRVTHGLFTLEQVDLVNRMMRVHAALNEFGEVDRKQAYLLYVREKNYAENSSELLRARLDWADWNIEAYYRSIPPRRDVESESQEGETPLPRARIERVAGPNATSRIIEGQGVATDTGLPVNDLIASLKTGRHARFEVNPRIRTAARMYEEVSAVLRENDRGLGDMLRESEKKLANTAFLVKQGFDLMLAGLSPGEPFYQRAARLIYDNPVVVTGYRQGRDALARLVEHTRDDPEANARALALAIIELADWHLSYRRLPEARDAYLEAREVLAGAGHDARSVDAFFNPRPVVEIPTFAFHYYSRALLGLPSRAQVEYQGEVEATLSVAPDGETRDVEILSASEGTPEVVTDALALRLRMAKVRPRVAGGELIPRENLTVRYAYSY